MDPCFAWNKNARKKLIKMIDNGQTKISIDSVKRY